MREGVTERATREIFICNLVNSRCVRDGREINSLCMSLLIQSVRCAGMFFSWQSNYGSTSIIITM